MTYRFYVSVDNGKVKEIYRGDDPADAMAAWSKAVTEDGEYVVLEALKSRVEDTPPLLRVTR